MIVNVELDNDQSWLFEEPGWQDLGYGVSDGIVYWWSARHLVVLPVGTQAAGPVIISTDEDIHLAFSVSEGWILVCETSVRLVIDGAEASRLDFGEVLLAARWEGHRLVIGDANGHDIKVAVADGRLVT